MKKIAFIVFSYSQKTSIFWSKKDQFLNSIFLFLKTRKNFWTVLKVSPFYDQHCPLNTFGHNFNRFCDISFQNLKSRFFAVFLGLILTLNICKSSKKLPMTPRFGQKLPLIFPVKVIKFQSRTKCHLKMKFFFGLGGSIWPPPQARIGLIAKKGIIQLTWNFKTW